MTDSLKSLQTLNTELEQLQVEINEKAQALLKPALKEYFEKYPFVAELRWESYVPYFNDGDACEFSVGEVCCLTAKDQEEDENSYYESGNDFASKSRQHTYDWSAGNSYKKVANADFDEQYQLAQINAGQIVDALPLDSHKQLFGEHVRVRVNREEGLVAEEYTDHD